MTSLEMAGFSITLLKLDEELKQLLLAPADTPGSGSGYSGGVTMANCLIAAIEAIGAAIASNKEELTSLDAAIGDGDHGINMARGFQAVSTKLSTLAQTADAATVLKTVGMTLDYNSWWGFRAIIRNGFSPGCSKRTGENFTVSKRCRNHAGGSDLWYQRTR